MHISELRKVVERGEFSLRFVKRNGEEVTIERCVCTSFHSAGTTLNVLVCSSGEVRKITRTSIIAVNDKNVYL